MKRIKLAALAFRIEYHWFIISRIRRNPNSERYAQKEQMHKFKAEHLSIEYEIRVGLRDWTGKIIA